MKKWKFTIVDPFDATYNPARAVDDKTHQKYKFLFKKMN